MKKLHYKKRRKNLRKRIFLILFTLFGISVLGLAGNFILTRKSKAKASSSVINNLNNKNITGDTSTDANVRENNIQVGTDMDNHLDQLSIKGQKTAYLTFDDGPSPNVTPKILDILNNYNVKATFFVIGRQASANKNLIIRENKEGNAIGDHTYTHDYTYIYQNTKNLVDDFDKCRDTVKSILGHDYNIKYVRFPGGAFGADRKPFREAVMNAGYSFIDWNSLNGDAEGSNIPSDKLVNRLKETSKGKNTLVVLMHDAASKQTTVQALPQIIEYLKASGYVFKTLN